jgi:hypothetical protein
MEKLVLLSIVAVTIAVPAAAAAERNSRVALRKTLAWMLIGIFAYLASVVFIYPRLLG